MLYFINIYYFTVYYREGNGNPLQYSCLENPMDRGAWWAAVHGVAKGRTWLSDFTFTFHFHALKKEMAPTPVSLPWESQGRRSLVGCCLWGCTELDTTAATAAVYYKSMRLLFFFFFETNFYDLETYVDILVYFGSFCYP